MRWKLTFYVAGKTFTDYVYAVNYKDAAATGLARNPKAKLISANPTYEKE